MAATLHILPAMYEGSVSSASSPTLVIFCFFFFKLFLIGVKWCLIMVLNSISVLSNSVEHLYMGLLVICIFSLEKCLFKTFAHLKNWVTYLFIIELYKFFTYLEYLILIKCMICKYFLPFSWLLFPH